MQAVPHTTVRKATVNIKGFFNNIKNPMKIAKAKEIITDVAAVYSPITLNTSWPILLRLSLIIFLTCIGTIMNGFFVASFFIDKTLQNRGNVYLACTGLADIILTGIVIPISGIEIIAGQWNSWIVCRGLQILTQTSTYSYSMFYTLLSAEKYFRICSARKNYTKFMSMSVVTVSSSIFIVSFLVSFLGVYFELDYDYCERDHFGHLRFRLTTLAIFHIMPFMTTVALLYCTFKKIRTEIRDVPKCRRSCLWDTEYVASKIDILCFALFVAAWIPYHVMVYIYPETQDVNFYNCVWFGVARSVISSFFFSTIIDSFRTTFAHLFFYCCCKNSIPTPAPQRNRRRREYEFATDDVEVYFGQVEVSDGVQPGRNPQPVRL